MRKQDENRRSSFWSKAYWTDEGPWPNFKRTLVACFILVVLLGDSRFVA